VKTHNPYVLIIPDDQCPQQQLWNHQGGVGVTISAESITNQLKCSTMEKLYSKNNEEKLHETPACKHALNY
jgi:hypothetical protein